MPKSRKRETRLFSTACFQCSQPVPTGANHESLLKQAQWQSCTHFQHTHKAKLMQALEWCRYISLRYRDQTFLCIFCSPKWLKFPKATQIVLSFASPFQLMLHTNIVTSPPALICGSLIKPFITAEFSIKHEGEIPLLTFCLLSQKQHISASVGTSQSKLNYHPKTLLLNARGCSALNSLQSLDQPSAKHTSNAPIQLSYTLLSLCEYPNILLLAAHTW